jgi:hypothetical protein
MSRNYLFTALLSLLCAIATDANAQTIDTSTYNAGIWQYMSNPLSKQDQPEVQGRLTKSFRWADIEPSPNVWNWVNFDSVLTDAADDGLPIIFLVFTKQDAPDWLFTNGVPKVIEKDDAGNVTGYAPYYADTAYNRYFKRMISTVSQHVATLPDAVRKQIIAVQACFGSTGDYISYKGNVAPQYQLTNDQFFGLFKDFSQYYYDQYRTYNPSIRLLSNPSNTGDDQYFWLLQNCPGSWFKQTMVGKGYQLNDEKTKSGWLYSIMNNRQNGAFLRTRCEITGDGVVSGWWNECPYKNMFALMCYGIYWGLDWSNQSPTQLNDPLFDSAFNFFNKYAGQKDPAKSTNAICVLKDAIDASDVKRFPENIYGTATRNTARMLNVLAPFTTYGAKQEDPATATLDEYSTLSSKGINDVGWDIFPGNYDRYLHQINANNTSAGYWNVQSSDPNTMYGRFARGFDLNNGKNALYFAVDSAFLNNAPLDGKYPVMIEITYLDKGAGKFKLFYDAETDTNKPALAVTCKNTGLWKKASVTLTDAYFGKRGKTGSDFYIKSTGTENVLFSVVELARPHTNNSDIGLYAPPVSFDTVCVNSSSAPDSFAVSGMFLDGSKVTVGPAKGYSFATSVNGTYTDSIRITKYGASFKQLVYIKFNPQSAGVYGSIPVKGGGANAYSIPVTAVAVNNMTLNPDIKNISCYNAKDASINLTQSGGTAPFKYSWTSTDGFKSTTQNISGLKPSTYTVNVTSSGGCVAKATYEIAQPDKLETVITSDDMLCKGGTTNLYVTATGGTKPYTGTGTFVVTAGFKTYSVTDANGCNDQSGFTVSNGTLTVPSKPASITGATADGSGLCGGGDFQFSVSSTQGATSYTWMSPAGCTTSNANSDGSNIILHAPADFKSGTLSVYATNVCGNSNNAETKTLYTIPAKPGSISGPASVSANKSGLKYSVPSFPGVTYVWTVPGKATITSGQNTSSITVTWGTSSGNVTVSATNNCGASSYKSLLYVTATSSFGSSMQSEDMNVVSVKELTLQPNPAKSITYLSFHADKQYAYTLQLFDITGKLLLQKNAVAQTGLNNVPINVEQFTNGLYFVALKNDKGEIKTVKLVKE